MFKKGDFHIHSTASDGGCTPTQIVMMAKEKKVDILSITDHNTTSGLSEGIKAGESLGITVIPGIELSTRYNKTRVHVLGYFKDDSYNNDLLINILKCIKSHKLSKVKHLLSGVIDFTESKNNLSVKSGIELLKFFGATVVLAHPVLIPRKDFLEIIKLDFDGLEAKYFSNTSSDTEYFIDIANKKDMLYTAGSDFHKFADLLRAHGMIGDVFLSQNEIHNFLLKGNLPYY